MPKINNDLKLSIEEKELIFIHFFQDLINYLIESNVLLRTVPHVGVLALHINN